MEGRFRLPLHSILRIRTPPGPLPYLACHLYLYPSPFTGVVRLQVQVHVQGQEQEQEQAC